MKVKILPSLLAADMGRLAEEAQRAVDAGGDELHMDIMDGHFVPNISMGPAVVAMADRTVEMPLSVHLMLTHPDRYIDVFAEAGADTILIHVEAACDVAATLDRIRQLGVKPGITLNPQTPASAAEPLLERVDEVLCMTVNPGYGGQSFMDSVLPKIRAVRETARRLGRADLSLMVDGGITVETAGRCAAQGANAFVAGTFLFDAPGMAQRITEMRAAAQGQLERIAVTA